nr:alpha/beta fold hydrolase [Chloroflexaceae bacterium]
MLFFTALSFWLCLFETLFGLTGLRGVTWGLDWPRGAAGLALPVLARQLWRGGPWAILVLLLALLPALAMQLGLASLRRWQLNPLLRLRPGSYADRSITRLDIPTDGGLVPALHVVPHGGAQAAICIAHGSGCDKTFYAWGIVDELVERGFAVLLIDLDGHGESPRPQAFPAILYNISGCVAWLRGHYRRVGVLGISLGGCVAARAVANGTAVDALALWEAPTELALTKQQIDRIVIIEALRLLRPSVLPILRDGSLYHVIRAWQTTGIRAEIGTWDLFMALDLLGSLRKMAEEARTETPLLLVYGGNDAIVLPGEAERVRQARPPWARFELRR